MKDQTPATIAAEAAARRSYGKLVAFLAARNRDVASAEDALAEAFAAALEQWPRSGPPANPEAWLLTVARRKQIDSSRRNKTVVSAWPHLQLLAGEGAEASDMPIPDQRLALMFVCAHPAIDPAVRTPLMLQTVLGFEAAAIAPAFLVSPATMSQRLVRAKAKIKQAGIAFRVPDREELPERLEAVLEAIYACFADGWADAAGSEAGRRGHATEAIWLGELITELLPEEAEAKGLLALMLYADSRKAARRDDAGRYVALPEQDVKRWDRALIARAEALLREASGMQGTGRFQLLAAIQSAHAMRGLTGRTDWDAIVQIYDGLYALTGSPVVAINRAVAAAGARGPRAGLAALEAVAVDSAIAQYQPYWAAKARLLADDGQIIEADEAYGLAIGLEADPAVRAYLIERRRALRQ